MLTGQVQSTAVQRRVSAPSNVRSPRAERPSLAVVVSERQPDANKAPIEATSSSTDSAQSSWQPDANKAPIEPTAVAQERCFAAFSLEVEYVRQSLRRFGADRSEVDDLAQEVFLVLYRRWSDYDSSRPLRPYLFGIAFRLVLAHQRKRRRELVIFGIAEIGDDAPGPEDALCAKQAYALVQAALERIPMPRRAVLMMHEFDHVPVNEVASMLSIPPFTVYSRLRKARRELEVATRRLMGASSTLSAR